jgi:hypothetical protein
MGSADLPEAAATLYSVSQQCGVFVFRHANLHTTGIRKAARGVAVLPPLILSDDANSSCMQQRDG